jgi:enoyl-CoA hydratase/carnithine racemase
MIRPGLVAAGAEKGEAVAELLDLEVTDRVGILRLKRPPLNILNRALVTELAAAAVEAAHAAAIGAVVISGEGRHFSAGADVREFQTMSVPEVYEYGKLLDDAFRGWADLPKVTIAAVNGFALGGGCELALAADFRFASDRATLGLPEIELGIIPGGGGTQRLPRLVGPARAKEMIFTGRHVKAQEALAVGLVDAVVPAAELLERAVEAARRYASGPLVALRAAKALVNRATGDIDVGLDLERHAFSMLFGTEDWRTGAASLAENGPGKATFSGE